jgi:hypothetical protein
LQGLHRIGIGLFIETDVRVADLHEMEGAGQRLGIGNIPVSSRAKARECRRSRPR